MTLKTLLLAFATVTPKTNPTLKLETHTAEHYRATITNPRNRAVSVTLNCGDNFILVGPFVISRKAKAVIDIRSNDGSDAPKKCEIILWEETGP